MFVVTVAAALFAILAVAVAELGGGMIDRTRAQAVADAVALAAIDGGRDAAVRLADLNGGTVVSWSAGPGADEVTVTVRVGDATATARATDAP